MRRWASSFGAARPGENRAFAVAAQDDGLHGAECFLMMPRLRQQVLNTQQAAAQGRQGRAGLGDGKMLLENRHLSAPNQT